MARWLTIVCVILLYAVPTRAQTGQVTGTVMDPAGLGVPGATVQIAGAAGTIRHSIRFHVELRPHQLLARCTEDQLLRQQAARRICFSRTRPPVSRF